MTNKPATRMQSVKSKEGEILNELVDVKSRWEENYEELYNTQNHVDKEMADGIPQMPSFEEEPDILREEVAAAVRKLSDNKTPGYDNTSAEERYGRNKCGHLTPTPKALSGKLRYSQMTGAKPSSLLYTRKRDKLDCGNYRESAC